MQIFITTQRNSVKLHRNSKTLSMRIMYGHKKIPAVSPKRRPRGNTPVGVDGFEPPTLCL